MKILCIVKRVEDWEIKIKVKADGSGIETEQMKYVVNPFDEIAVEEALRLRDTHSGEVVVASIGVDDTIQQIRTALAMGADRGVHIVSDSRQDPLNQAKAFAKVVEDEKPDLVIVGKQAVDDDLGQLGIILAEKLGWAQASFASKEEALDSQAEKEKQPALKVEGEKLSLLREVDGGLETLSLTLPAVVTTDLRLNEPRYATLPGIMKAKKKEVKAHPFAELVPDATASMEVIHYEAPSERAAGQIVSDVATLVEKLQNEAKAL